MRHIVHLVDDVSPGGVTRLLDYIKSSDDMAALGRHEVVQVDGGLSRPPKVKADVIVNHVVLSWRNLPFFMALRARHRRCPIVHMEHSYSPAFVKLHVANTGRFRAMLTISLSLFDRVISISTAQRDWLTAFARLPEDKVTLVPPFVDISRFLALDPPSGAICKIGALGRLDGQKGFDILIRAFVAADLPGVSLEIFGDGADRSDLEALSAGHDRIHFHGHTEDPVAAIGSVDAIAMPSRREPYGLVALEALAAARPLLVSRADGLIDHAANGALPVAQLTTECWAEALASLVRGPRHDGTVARKNVRDAGQRFVHGWRSLLEDVAP